MSFTYILSIKLKINNLRCVNFPRGLGTAITNPSVLDVCNTGLLSSAKNRGCVSSLSPVNTNETFAVVPAKQYDNHIKI